MLAASRITALLAPFLNEAELSPHLIAQLQTYLDLLLRWNARMNLTAVRDPEQIVTRHFGESLFAARILRDAGAFSGTPTLSDIGSGAGFPGIPIKLFAPNVQLTLIESQNKKATFLREVIRALQMGEADVFSGRADVWGHTAQVVTLRAVEKFEAALPVAASMVQPGGTLCLLIGARQSKSAKSPLGGEWQLDPGRQIPGSVERVIQLARHE